jgi:hypothetical protein
MRMRMALIAAGISGILAVGGGTAYAAVSSVVDSSGVIHGCVSNGAVHGTHILVVHEVGTPCPSGTTELTWSQQGPAGLAGPPGPKGDTGATGPAGAKGDTGAPGADGAQGTPGPPGLKGDTGAPGADGAQGPPGPAGLKGDTGAPGADGAQGPPGPAGPAGPAGAAGVSTAGPAGLDVITVSQTIPASGGAILVICPVDHPYALGGGAISATSSVPPYRNGPVLSPFGNSDLPAGTADGWQAADVGAGLTVYAICAR